MKVLFGISLLLVAVAALPAVILNLGDSKAYSTCSELYIAGYKTNGRYTLTVNGVKNIGECYFYTTYTKNIFLNRIDDKVSWNRTYGDYVIGFGDPLHDYFSGLQSLHVQTNGVLKVGLEVRFMDWNGVEKNYIYQYFKVDNYLNNYKITLWGDTFGNAEANLDNINGMTFHTYDRPDKFGKAKLFSTGWWYNNAVYALPTGRFYDQNNCCPTTSENGIMWGDRPDYGYKYSYKRLVMATVQHHWLAVDRSLY